MSDPSTYPLLFIQSEERTQRARRGGGGGDVHSPSPARQVQRIEPKLETLQNAFAERRATLQAGIEGSEPEQVLVLETVGTVENFVNAVQRISGLEFLGEFDETDIPPDEDFFDRGDADKSLSGTVYLLMTNMQAMEELLRLWRQFRDNPDASFGYGLTRFRDLFRLLRDIRAWGPEDRLRETGVLEYWRETIELGRQVIPTEVELWYRDDESWRESAQSDVRNAVESVGGEIVTSATIPDIRYHAVLANLPIDAVESLLEDVAAIELVRADVVMFMRPAGQSVRTPGLEAGAPTVPELPPAPNELAPPTVALLDGLPVEQHDVLAGRLIVDDPDNLASQAIAGRRRHGTAMASLILHGDLNAPKTPLSSRLYVRPILQTGPDWVPNAIEKIPADALAVDLVHRAVRRLFEGASVAPSVRIVNVSVGDSSSPFARILSPWARLLDWLAWRYQILIVVSAGNHLGAIDLPIECSSVSGLTGEEIERVTLRTLAERMQTRRLLPPAEAVNALTVGAAHHDDSVANEGDPRHELITSPWLSAPYSALGLGFRRGIKPDVLMAGGRRFYQMAPSQDGDTCTFVDGGQVTSPPGQLVASPSHSTAVRRQGQYWAGTSNAAALMSRAAAELHDVLASMRDGGEAPALTDQGVFVAALKALLVHSAELGEGSYRVRNAVGDRVDNRKMREYVCRFLGYGRVEPERTQSSSAQRATLIGGGRLSPESADVFTIPLPPSLSGRVEKRRLTLTLAWFTPINPRDRRYRRAFLWFDPPQAELRVRRREADWQAARRGTVQHEILEGEEAAVFNDGNTLSVQVNCAAYAGSLREPVPYALAASLEVAPSLGLPIYTEVAERIRPRVAVRPST